MNQTQTAILTLIIGLNAAWASANPEAGRLERDILAHFSQFDSFQLDYTCTFHDAPARGERLAHLSQTVDDWKAKLAAIPEDDPERLGETGRLRASIGDFQRMIEGGAVHSLQIFSSDGKRHRIDEFRGEGNLDHVYYGFDGMHGYAVTPADGRVQTAPGLTFRWFNPKYAICYGASLDVFLRNGCEIASAAGGDRVIKMTSPHAQHTMYAFHLLEGSDFHWNQCDVISTLGGGKTVSRVVCGDFQNDNGLLVPGNVKIFTLDGETGAMRLLMEYQLQNAKVGNVQFADDFFNPPNNGEVVRHGNR